MQQIGSLKFMKKNIVAFILLIILSGCKKDVVIKQQPKFDKILILGNSITHSKPDPSIGWLGDWGMAASAREKDFVHLLAQKFKASNLSSTLDFKNISDFENSFWKYKLDNLDTFTAEKYDLLILRIGENVPIDSLAKHDFKIAYRKLIENFQVRNPKIKILCVPSFWDQPQVEELIIQVANEKNIPTTILKSLSYEITNTAWGLFSNFGVATHPSDKGMQGIADRIWNKLQTDPYFRP